ncbi:MAG: hypothetical protein EPN85_09880 [Bacteroidetes bacterium]|nr:MAG: hypothetical protein EPN85_09880 [Bacteroidota bacterium]
MIRTANINILEGSSVTIYAGRESTAFPLYRTYDRDINRNAKILPSTVGSPTVPLTEVRINTTSTKNVDMLMFPHGHNLSGMEVYLWGSTNSSFAGYTVVSTFTPNSTNSTGTTFSECNYPYWSIHFATTSATVELGEIFLTKTYTWERDPIVPTGAIDDVFNVENLQTSGGYDRFLEMGTAKKKRTYQVICENAQATSIESLNTNWGGKKPFWLYDHTGKWIYGKLSSPINERCEIKDQLYYFDFDFLEVI